MVFIDFDQILILKMESIYLKIFNDWPGKNIKSIAYKKFSRFYCFFIRL